MRNEEYLDQEADRQELIHQLSLNTIQLRDLLAMEKTDRINIYIYVAILLLLVSICIILFSTLIFNGFDFIIRGELRELSGSIIIFIIAGVSKIINGIHNAWTRRDEIKFLIHQQEGSIEHAKKILNTYSY
ncbi:hypothetical protein [Methylomagnum ishizawai]|uniref:hypothetical protein n=1 Tax=Methylomagnum ishizawai TaxID=1760988 RepID=UPI001C32C69D|nr:hypothetical protein [Methylomagnum ishizawai]BBL75440.1 hypothetical protein MishRS11D_25380 [Methylomagnum ishizawai]